MEVFHGRLSAIFRHLEETELTKTKKVTRANIAAFLKVLNKAAPVNDYDKTVGEFVRYMYKNGRGAFYKYIEIAKMPHLVLLTDGIPIANALDLHQLIEIHWDKSSCEFIVDSLVEMPSAVSKSTNDAAAKCNNKYNDNPPADEQYTSTSKSTSDATANKYDRPKYDKPNKYNDRPKHSDKPKYNDRFNRNDRPNKYNDKPKYNGGYNNVIKSRDSTGSEPERYQIRGNKYNDNRPRPDAYVASAPSSIPPLNPEQCAIIIANSRVCVDIPEKESVRTYVDVLNEGCQKKSDTIAEVIEVTSVTGTKSWAELDDE